MGPRKSWVENAKSTYLKGLILVVILFVLFCEFIMPGYVRAKNYAGRSEAKGNLSGVYQAMTATLKETGEFETNFTNIGFQPDGELNYLIGFSPNCPGVDRRSLFESLRRQSKYFHQIKREKLIKFFEHVPCVEGFPNEWEAFAVGLFGERELEVWRIGSDKRLEQYYGE